MYNFFTNKMEEIYKEFDDNYEVSNFGNVRNKNTERILKNSINNRGYYNVNLYNDGIVKNHRIHRLVAITFIENPENKRCIDHINRDKLNNHENNLRWATHAENQRNSTKQKNTSSKYKGVNFEKKPEKWRARININKKYIHLGCYDTEEEAGLAYNNYIIELKLKEFFVLNKII